ncbi:MAG: ABC transporter substrate-binding protein [Candidatus Latescibacteria bacterium]|nr:ABC transporter substrate-binding protein [Candidatus Latescibacterota bacterium]
MAIPISAQSIAVIKSRDQEVYNQVLDSFLKNSPTISTDQIVEYNLKGEEKAWKNIANKLVSEKITIILALGPLAAQMANEASLGIPVIFGMVSNPSRYGLAGENLAGISMDVSGETQFALYKMVVPDLKTIGVIYDPEKSKTLITEASQAAENLDLELIKVPVSSSQKVPKALRSMLGKIDALWMVPDDTVLTTQSFRFFLVTSFEKNLPFLAISDIFVKVGALATIAPDPIEMGQQLGQLVSEIQSGQLDLTKTNILPPTETNLVINVKTAEKIGLIIAPEILQTASKLYQ